MIADKIIHSLTDIVYHTRIVARLVARGRPAFDSDEMLRFAAEDLIIRMGESVERISRVDATFVAEHPSLDLRKLKTARNVLAHGYDIVDYDIVWSIME